MEKRTTQRDNPIGIPAAQFETHKCEHCETEFLSEAARDGHKAVCDEAPTLVTDGGYVRETGEGYCGRYQRAGKITISLATAPVDWTVGETVFARASEDGVVIQRPEPDVALTSHRIGSAAPNGSQPCLHISRAVLNELGVPEGKDVRLYEHEAGLELVAADDDPKLVTDGGIRDDIDGDKIRRGDKPTRSRRTRRVACDECGVVQEVEVFRSDVGPDVPGVRNPLTTDENCAVCSSSLSVNDRSGAQPITDGGRDGLPSFCAVDEHGGPTVMFDGGDTCICGAPLETAIERDTGICEDCDFSMQAGRVSTDRTGGSGLDSETYLDIDEVLEIAQEQADNARVRYHIKQARSIQQAQEVDIDD